MDLLSDLQVLHDKWDAKGGQSGNDAYEDALYQCINELGDVINKHEKELQLGTKKQIESTIREWPADDWQGLIHYINKVWDFDYGRIRPYEDKLCFITGGWSENEAIIGALEQNTIIVVQYWLSSHRGGEYWYEF